MVVNRQTEAILATAFTVGSQSEIPILGHDFQLFKESRTVMAESIRGVADTGHQGLTAFHANSQTPAKKSKHHPLTPQQKASNRTLSRERMLVENVIRKLKTFRILSERYRNRRKRFALRFNLIAAIYNLELDHPR